MQVMDEFCDWQKRMDHDIVNHEFDDAFHVDSFSAFNSASSILQ